MKNIFIVFSYTAGEGVVFDDKNDAAYAATGEKHCFAPGISSLAQEWRDLYAENNEQFEIIEKEI
jgi:hypothetical protein